MTGNQINYWNLQEMKRSNLAKEQETKRSNVAKEQETARSNRQQEELKYQQNAEQRRSNYRNEQLTERGQNIKGSTDTLSVLGRIIGGLL